MSQNITPVLVRDDRLCPTDNINYAVYKSGSSITHQTFRATSATPSSHVYTIFCPSVNTLISSELIWESTITFTIAGIVPTNGDCLVKLGQTDALAPFPLSSLVQTMSCQINNTSVSNNFVDTLPLMLRAMPKEDLLHYASMTPTYLDNCLQYSPVSVPIASNAVADLLTSLNSATSNNPLSSFGFADDEGRTPRGSFQIQSIDGNTPTTAINQARSVTIVVKIAEPILLSPFTTLTNKKAMYGITNLNFTMNLDSACKRAYRKVDAVLYGTSVTASFTNSQIVCEFITPSADTILPQINCVSYTDLPRFLTTFTSTVPPSTLTTSATGQSFAPVIELITSNSIQLNQIPTRLFIAVKKIQSALSYEDPDSFLAISGVSINWNNTSGLLASADQTALYNMSREAGYNDTFTQWSGLGVQAPTFRQALSGANYQNLNQFNTNGSILMLEMGRHVPLSEAYYAPSSIGQFNLQFNISVANYTNAALNVEVILMVQNDGVFVNNNGNSSVYTGVLSKQMVLDASLQTPVIHGDLQRMIGKGWWDKVKSGFSSALPYLKQVAEVGAPLLRKQLEGKEGVKGHAGSALKALGYGMSGGGESGGGMSGGGMSGGRMQGRYY